MVCISRILFVVYILNFVRTNGAPSSPKVTSQLKQLIDEKHSSDIMITFDIPSSKTLAKISANTATITNRAAKLKTIADALEQQALVSQKSARDIIKSEALLKSQVLWITNHLSIKAATAPLIDKLAALNEVTKIDVDNKLDIIDPPVKSESNVKKAPRPTNSKYGQLTYGLEKIKVPEVWSQGYYGQGIVVANLDGGVDVKHDAIRESYVGNSNYGWCDQRYGSEYPVDDHGHGTHTMGTMVGQNGIGVAPGAKWMTCATNYTLSSLLACFQHFLCPGDNQGRNRNCSKAPRVLSNSWGLKEPSPPGSDGHTLYEATLAFQDTDIFIVFSTGNYGPECQTCGAPARYPETFSVGCTDYMDVVQDFSSSGPSVNTSITKPLLVAPGAFVISSIYSNLYEWRGGTSMSAPHVSGIIALMLSKNPNLKREEIWEILIKSTEPVPRTDYKGQCESIPLDQYPNNRAGYGRINALMAINSLKLP